MSSSIPPSGGSAPPGRVPMVWMPTLGVWAAAGQGASQQAEKPAAVRTDQLQHSRQDSPSAGLLPIKRKAEDRQRAMASAELAEQGTHHQHHHHHRQPHHARHRPEQLAEVQQVQQQQQQGYTGFDLQEQTSDREASEVEVEEEEHELPPTCPICLVDVVHLEEKAVLCPCMHAFHHDCILLWLDRKRLCPLCKARVTSVLFDIKSPSRYREKEIPPTPPSAAAVPPRDFSSLLSGRGLAAREEPRRLEFRGGGELGGWAERRPRDSRAGRMGWRGEQRQRGGGSAAGSSAGQEPRPYFWRLHQRMQSGGLRVGADGPATDAAEGEVDAVLRWRRQVYQQGLYAEPPQVEERSRFTVGSGSSRERRLSEWLDRELRALLRTDDVTLLKAFCLGLVSISGLEPGPPSAAASRTAARAGSGTAAAGGIVRRAASAAAPRAAAAAAVPAAAVRAAGGGTGGGVAGGGSSSADPVAALQPFLHENAEHFWHELCCFAASPFTLQTYDRTVRYARREPPPAQLSAPAPPSFSTAYHLQQLQQLQQQQQQRQQPHAIAQGPPLLTQQAGPRPGRTSRWDRVAGPGLGPAAAAAVRACPSQPPSHDADSPATSAPVLSAPQWQQEGGSPLPHPQPAEPAGPAVLPAAQGDSGERNGGGSSSSSGRPRGRSERGRGKRRRRQRSRSRSRSRGSSSRRRHHRRDRSSSSLAHRLRRRRRSSRGRSRSREGAAAEGSSKQASKRRRDRRHKSGGSRKHRGRRRERESQWVQNDRGDSDAEWEGEVWQGLDRSRERGQEGGAGERWTMWEPGQAVADYD